MQKSNAPQKLTMAFASGSGAGPVNAVPLTPGTTAGTASYQTGFTSVNMEPIASGGVPPFGADFNGLFKAATTAQIWQQSGFTWTFDAAFAASSGIGGYPAQSVLMMGSGNGLWINKTDNNTTSPDATGSAGWLGLPAVGAYTVSTTGGSKTLDPSVLGVTTLLVTGALTSNAVLVLPLTAGSRWIIANNTTGAHTLTVQGASGAGVSVSQGSALAVFTDGTAYYAAGANTTGSYLPLGGTAVAATKLATARTFSITGLATASGLTFDGTGNVALNVTALNVPSALGYTPANDSEVVHIAGSETITGAKTFSGLLTSATFNATGSDRRLKSGIRKVDPRPFHRGLKFVTFKRDLDGSRGFGVIAQHLKRLEPAYIGRFKIGSKTYYSVDMQSLAYEQAVWASQEVDRLTLRLRKLEAKLERATLEPRQRGFVRRLLEAIW